MSILNYHCKGFKVKLQIEKAVENKMINESRKHYPKEFGGILLGRYSEDLNTAIVTDIIIPIDYQNSRHSFKRNTKGIESKLKEEFNKVPSIIYLGEWHTHPDSSSNPSQTDINTLKYLSEIDSVMLINPIMLIIGLTMNEFHCSFYVINDSILYKYEKDNTN